MVTENNGVVYYKLDPEYHYKGDETKNCGLSGGEIDGNFHFLRGYDISSIDVSSDKNFLVVNRMNGEKMTLDISRETKEYGFYYDDNNGILSIVNPNGEKFDLEGFLTKNDIVKTPDLKIETDTSIEGDGTIYNPMRVTSIVKTGQYRPVIGVVDLRKNEELPKNASLNDRYITVENASQFGLLYPLSGVRKLQKDLAEGEWRIPTKQDWDILLNSIEDCDDCRNHDSNGTNRYLGVNAGAYLKSVEYWKPIYRLIQNGEVVLAAERFSKDSNGNYYRDEEGDYVQDIMNEDKYGFSIYPVGYGDSKGADYIYGFGEWAAYWTITEDNGDNETYIKLFSNKNRGVDQKTWGEDCFLSVRLVKDYKGNNYRGVETINGQNVSTQLFPMVDDNGEVLYDNSLIWTSENISFDGYGGEPSKEWLKVEQPKTRYFINDWDGEKWVKAEIQQGESVVVFDVNGIKMHEWQVVGNELVDNLGKLQTDSNDTFAIIKNKIDDLTVETHKLVENEAAARNAADENILTIIGEIDSESNSVSEWINSVETKLEESIGDVTGSVGEALELEAATRETKDNEHDQRFNAAEAQLSTLEARIATLEKILQSLTPKALELENRITVLESGVVELENSITNLENEINNQIAQQLETINDRLGQVVTEAVTLAKQQIITTDVFKGADNEVSVTVQDGKVIYGFADDAIFEAGE